MPDLPESLPHLQDGPLPPGAPPSSTCHDDGWQYMEHSYFDLLLEAWERRHAGDRQEGRDRLAGLTAQVTIISFNLL